MSTHAQTGLKATLREVIISPAPLPHSVGQVTPPPDPSLELRLKARNLLANVLDALENRRRRKTRRLIEKGAQFMTAVPTLTDAEAQAVRAAVSIYKAATSETHDLAPAALAAPESALAKLDTESLHKLLTCRVLDPQSHESHPIVAETSASPGSASKIAPLPERSGP